MWKAKLYTELDLNSCTGLTVQLSERCIRVFQVKVNYDGLTWRYTIRGRNLLLEQMWTDFEREGRAKCFLKYIYNENLHTLLCGRVY